jgi:hypothetical protein
MPSDEGYDGPRLRCSLCRHEAIEWVVWRIIDGDLWRIPIRICTNTTCLEKQGAAAFASRPNIGAEYG